VNGGEERIERCRWNYSCASIQSHCVVSVPVPALRADAVIDGDIDLGVQLQGEDIAGGEWIAPFAPTMAERSTALYRTLRWGHHTQYQRVPDKIHRRGRRWAGEQMLSVYRAAVRCSHPYSRSLRVVALRVGQCGDCVDERRTEVVERLVSPFR
jgi:hypothetical protein